MAKSAWHPQQECDPLEPLSSSAQIHQSASVDLIQTSHRRAWPRLHRKHSACLHATPLVSQTYGCILICRRQFARSVRVPCADQGFLCDQHGILTLLFCAPYTLMLKFGGDTFRRDSLGVDRWGIVGHQHRLCRSIPQVLFRFGHVRNGAHHLTKQAQVLNDQLLPRPTLMSHFSSDKRHWRWWTR